MTSTARKQRLPWMRSRLRRLHSKRKPSESQIRRAFQLRLAIAKLTHPAYFQH